MKIQQSTVFLEGQHSQSQISAKIKQASVKETSKSEGTEVRLSLSTKTQQRLALQASSVVQDAAGNQNQMHQSEFTKQLTEAITESEINISQWQGNLQNSSNGKLIEIQSVTQVKSHENLSFEALGKVETEDGKTIDFMLSLDLDRRIEVEESAYFSSRVEMIDPLMLNTKGGSVELTDQWFDFDLLSDGSNKGLLKTAQGSGYLAFDKNDNGQIDNGKELFGPNTNNGFEELRQYDDDGNGWIDENDAIYSQLGMLTFDEDGAVFVNAKDAELGAIYLGAVGADYQLLSDEGAALGRIKQMGVGLSEQGQTLLIQEVHLQLNDSAQSISQSPQLELNKNAGIDQALSNDTSTLIQAELQQISLREWARETMADFTQPSGFDMNTALKNVAADQFNQQWSPQQSVSFSDSEESPQITNLRNMVEMLKQMREAQKSQQSMAAYKSVMQAS